MVCVSIFFSSLATNRNLYSMSMTPEAFWMAADEKEKTETFSLGKAFSIFLFWDNKA